MNHLRNLILLLPMISSCTKYVCTNPNQEQVKIFQESNERLHVNQPNLCLVELIGDNLNILGNYNQESNSILIRNNLNINLFYEVINHEMAHAAYNTNRLFRECAQETTANYLNNHYKQGDFRSLPKIIPSEYSIRNGVNSEIEYINCGKSDECLRRFKEDAYRRIIEEFPIEIYSRGILNCQNKKSEDCILYNYLINCFSRNY